LGNKYVNVIGNGVICVIRLKQKMTVLIICDLHVKSSHIYLRKKITFEEKERDAT